MSAVEAALSTTLMVEVEASLQRVARGEGTHEDANLLRSVIQRLAGRVGLLEEMDKESDQYSVISDQWSNEFIAGWEPDDGMKERLKSLLQEWDL
jgi:hypothetical protein